MPAICASDRQPRQQRPGRRKHQRAAKGSHHGSPMGLEIGQQSPIARPRIQNNPSRNSLKKGNKTDILALNFLDFGRFLAGTVHEK
jgi:hypothetical protein